MRFHSEIIDKINHRLDRKGIKHLRLGIKHTSKPVQPIQTAPILPWDRIPSEILDQINQYLDLKSIKNLRLVNKHTAERCLGPRFLSVAWCVRTDLTEASLRTLLVCARHLIFQKAVRRLVIRATIYDAQSQVPATTKLETFYGSRSPASEWLEKAQKARKFLPDEFIIHSLATAMKNFSALQEIKLEPSLAIAPNTDQWLTRFPAKDPWISHACFLTLAAVARSPNTVQEVDIYTRRVSDGRTDHIDENCGVSISDLARYIAKLSEYDANDVNLPIENLGLKVSGGNNGPSNPNHNISDLSAVGQLLNCMTNLNTLYLTFDFDYYLHPVLDSYYEPFGHIVDNAHLKNLNHLHLENLPLTVDGLLKMLKKHPTIVFLCLKNLRIPDDQTWEPLIKYIDAELLALEKLSISCLRQGGRLVELSPVPQWANIHSSRGWVLAIPTYTHSCPIGCEDFAQAHKILSRIVHDRGADSRFIFSQFSIDWNFSDALVLSVNDTEQDAGGGKGVVTDCFTK